MTVTIETADDLLTALYAIPPQARHLALSGHGLRLLREAADLVGIDSAYLGKRSCIAAILENF